MALTAREQDPKLVALGRVIRRLREERNVSAGELAAAAELSPARLDALEAGRFDPTYDVLLALADALGIELAALVNRAGDLDRDAVCLEFGRRLRGYAPSTTSPRTGSLAEHASTGRRSANWSLANATRG